MLSSGEDAAVGARVTRGLVTFFGSQILPPKRLRLQDGAPRASIADRFFAALRMRAMPLLRRRALVSQTSDPHASASSANGLTRALRRTAALLVLIGPSWGAGGATLESMGDPVNPLRVSIEAALALGRPVVPVLLTGASMPSPAQLPASMREFAMLNAAWVRDDPDYPGDMRRLTRVIERLSRLREAQRASTTWIPLLLGVILSGLALMGVDALVAWLFLDTHNTAVQLATPSQTSTILTWSAVILADLAICGFTSDIVTSWSGKRQNGALAALLGASLAMLASVRAFVFLKSLLLPTEVAYVIDATHAFNAQTLNTLALLLIVRLPIQTLGALATSALGSFYGRMTYRGRERRVQERRLYAMARAATQSEPLAEMSARSARATAPVSTQPIAPDAPTLAASAVDAPPDDGSGIGPMVGAASGATSPIPGAPPVDSEDARREALQAAMRQARQRARNLTRVRLGVALGLVAAILLIVSIVARQTYTSQVSGISAESTAIAQRATAAAAATATYQVSPLNPYAIAAPGPDCDHSQDSGSGP